MFRISKEMNADFKYGLELEDALFESVKELYGDDIKKTDTYHPYDYYNANTFIELKARRCNHNRYPTTMIGKNKIEFAREHPDKMYIFLFKFYDGLYEHIYQPDNEYLVGIGGRSDRNKLEYKDYIYIPLKDLQFVVVV